MIKVIGVCGARPNFMKIAPLMKAFETNGNFKAIVVHTGQHYDANMSKLFFDDLNMPRPDINLEVGSASHAFQTAEIMKRFEPVILDFESDGQGECFVNRVIHATINLHSNSFRLYPGFGGNLCFK